MQTTYAAERRIDAPAGIVYHLLADYREHHRPGGFLPPAFSDQRILRGGFGGGTELRYLLTLGGREREILSLIAEPEPGRTLIEIAPGIETTFTVRPSGDGGTVVRFVTVLEEPGLDGLLTRLFAARLLRPIYEDELDRLERSATTHEPIVEATVATEATA